LSISHIMEVYGDLLKLTVADMFQNVAVLENKTVIRQYKVRFETYTPYSKQPMIKKCTCMVSKHSLSSVLTIVSLFLEKQLIRGHKVMEPSILCPVS